MMPLLLPIRREIIPHLFVANFYRNDLGHIVTIYNLLRVAPVLYELLELIVLSYKWASKNTKLLVIQLYYPILSKKKSQNFRESAADKSQPVSYPGTSLMYMVQFSSLQSEIISLMHHERKRNTMCARQRGGHKQITLTLLQTVFLFIYPSNM